MFTIGLTGGVGSGKSTVGKCFEALGVQVLNADMAAREVVRIDTPGFRRLVEHYGKGILNEQGAIDRAKLRKIVFSNPQERQWLESVLHPLIREFLDLQLEAATSDYVVKEIPLLIESDLCKTVDRVLVVLAARETRLQRLVQRSGLKDDEIQSIMASQVDDQTRRESADDIIDNQGSVEELAAQVEKLHNQYLQLATRLNTS